MIESSKTKTKPDKASDSKTSLKKPEQSYKFENYFDKKIPQKYIKPHQVHTSYNVIDIHFNVFYGQNRMLYLSWEHAQLACKHPEFDLHIQHILSWSSGNKNILTDILCPLLIQEEQFGCMIKKDG